ncbi:MAG: hypothetical protein LUC40_00840, partial [Oscillospiraceae bacterium]|nr:hypothetical protein [Oscillospiraceae bacterium]
GFITALRGYKVVAFDQLIKFGFSAKTPINKATEVASRAYGRCVRGDSAFDPAVRMALAARRCDLQRRAAVKNPATGKTLSRL